MIYLKSFRLLTEEEEKSIMEIDSRNIYVNHYPLGILSKKQFKDVIFDDITCFYGNNGTGKTTLINMIASKLNAKTKNSLNKGSYFNLYVKHCNSEFSFEEPAEIKLISSDDIFDYLLDIRAINSGVNRKKESLSKEFLDYKYNTKDYNIDEYEEIKNAYNSKSRYVRENLSNNNMQEYSNGQSSLMFWQREIKENGIYILDEPENSLSPENQIKLKNFIEDSVRFYNCQFIISTHSPFLLKLENSKIYNLDNIPVNTCIWEELDSIKLYYNFFKENNNSFEKDSL